MYFFCPLAHVLFGRVVGEVAKAAPTLGAVPDRAVRERLDDRWKRHGARKTRLSVVGEFGPVTCPPGTTQNGASQP
jgi:hypothetical protein